MQQVAGGGGVGQTGGAAGAAGVGGSNGNGGGSAMASERAELVRTAAAMAADASLCPAGLGAAAVRSDDGASIAVCDAACAARAAWGSAGSPGPTGLPHRAESASVVLDAAALASIVSDERLPGLPTARRIGAVAARLAEAATEPPSPIAVSAVPSESVGFGGDSAAAPVPEASLWLAMMPGRWVAHLHPTAVVALTASEDYRTQAGLLKPHGPRLPMFVDYREPGLPLARELAERLAEYRGASDGADPTVVFLQNDGVLISADGPDALLAAARDLAAQAAEITGLGDTAAVPAEPEAIPPDDEEFLAARVTDLRRVLFDAREVRCVIRAGHDPHYLPRLMAGPDAELVSAGVVTPAQLAACGASPFVMDGSAYGTLEGRLERWHEDNMRAWPRVALLGGGHYAVIGESVEDCRHIDRVFRTGLAAMVGAAGAGGRARVLSEAETLALQMAAVLRDRAGRRRRRAAESDAAGLFGDPPADGATELHNVAAMVVGGDPAAIRETSAALSAAGACVFAALDSDGTAPGPRAEEVGCAAGLNVEVESTVESAVRRCVLEFGGLDALVFCGPTVAHRPLDRLTDGDWLPVCRALTGYVRCARAAVRLFTHQRMGGHLIYIEPTVSADDAADADIPSATAALLAAAALNGTGGADLHRTASAALSGAVRGMNRAWSAEFADGRITANLLLRPAPSAGDSADPDPAADDLLRFLAGDRSRAVSGQALAANV